MDELTCDKPSVMTPVAGKTVLSRLVDKFKAKGIDDITLVGGYCSDAIDTHCARLVISEACQSTDELASLNCALESVGDDTVIICGNLLEALRAENRFHQLGVPDLVKRLIDNGHPPRALCITGRWMDINNLEDPARAGNFAHGQFN